MTVLRRSSFLLRIILLLQVASLAPPASSAEIRSTEYTELRYLGGVDAILEGKIGTGDYEKLLRLIDKDCDHYKRCTSGIFLGGDLIEAMKIGRGVRKLRLETHVPSDLPPHIVKRPKPS
jgi:hypothetical protein